MAWSPLQVVHKLPDFREFRQTHYYYYSIILLLNNSKSGKTIVCIAYTTTKNNTIEKGSLNVTKLYNYCLHTANQ